MRISEENVLRMYCNENTILNMEKKVYHIKPKSTVAQIRMNEGVKQQVEEVYAKLGITFAEAVRTFAIMSIACGGFPSFDVTPIDLDKKGRKPCDKEDIKKATRQGILESFEKDGK